MNNQAGSGERSHLIMFADAPAASSHIHEANRAEQLQLSPAVTPALMFSHEKYQHYQIQLLSRLNL